MRVSLVLYYHPLSSFCWKTLIALYENETPFEPHLVNLADAASSAAFKKLWPIGKFPVLRDATKDQTIPESSIIIEYLAQHYPGRTWLIPADNGLARRVRASDRFYDLYVHLNMQKIVGDRLRPEGQKDAFGVEQAKATMQTAYAMIDQEMESQTWATGEAFSMADCAAAPALFYANTVLPFGDGHKSVGRYLDRLKQRPSFARVLREAEPYFKMFPR
jgi:glutathione S-transferase